MFIEECSSGSLFEFFCLRLTRQDIGGHERGTGFRLLHHATTPFLLLACGVGAGNFPGDSAAQKSGAARVIVIEKAGG